MLCVLGKFAHYGFDILSHVNPIIILLMKKNIAILVLAIMPIVMLAQKKSVVLPGNGHIDVEKLNKNIDTNMDISQLSLSELRVLENAFAARQGVALKEAEIRNIYLKTSWYGDLMYNRFYSTWDNSVKVAPIKYTDTENKFIQRIQQREKELMKNNFIVSQGIVNADNVVNDYELDFYSGSIKEKLQQNGFVIVEDCYDQLFQVYDYNNYYNFPSFVTTDLYLQLFHLYFDSMLRVVEEKELSGKLLDFCMKMKNLMAKERLNDNVEISSLAEWNEAYFAIAVALLEGKPITGLGSNAYETLANTEIENVMNEQPNASDFLGYSPSVPYMYNLYRPRGHYTRSESLQRYFRAMMWLQNVPFGTENPHQLERAVLIAETIQDDKQLNDKFCKIVEPITFIMGEPDNVGIMQLQKIMADNHLKLVDVVNNQDKFDSLKEKVEKLDNQMTRIKPKFLYTSNHKINVMPQRYMPDAEVLQEMVDVKSKPTKRGESKGLDYFAAMGSYAAENILINELKEIEKWDKYRENLDKMKSRMKEIDWKSTVTNSWIDNLNVMLAADTEYPYFMKTEEWNRKNLNAALASWTEMKHDAILYAKQPIMAEGGDGDDIEPPVIKGYVEPNQQFWNKAVDLIVMTRKAFKKFDITNEQLDYVSDQMEEIAQQYANISRKELNDEELTEEEYGYINGTGPLLEYLSLQMVGCGDMMGLNSWNYVQGADKKVSLVADVLTANGDNNPNKTVLYEAVGPANEIYVIVEIGGCLYLTRGAVFSYREFSRGVSEERMTDEEWQLNLKDNPREGIPVWMNNIIIQRENMPSGAEHFSYDSYDQDEDVYDDNED